MRGEAGSSPKLAACLALVVLATACGREVPPEKVALEYARALYAQDRASAYRLLSAQDRAWKTEAVFVEEGEAPRGNALALARHLAAFIEVASAETKITGDRAKVRLTLRLPSANAPEVAGLVQDWDEAALNALSEKEAGRIRNGLDDLHRSGRLPTLEGEEAFELVRESSGWRLVLHPAGTIRVRFTARIPEGLPLHADPQEQELRVRSGESVQMSLRLKNSSGRGVSVRVTHVIEPKDAAPYLVFLHCPLLLPLKIPPRESQEISSSFMIAGNAPAQMQDFRVTFAFRRAE
jgi:hypothetical protein